MCECVEERIDELTALRAQQQHTYLKATLGVLSACANKLPTDTSNFVGFLGRPRVLGRLRLVAFWLRDYGTPGGKVPIQHLVFF